MKTFKQFLTEAKKSSSKYKEGEFGYWWTVIKGREDIEGKVYDGNIYGSDEDLTSLRGAPKEVKGDFWFSYNKLKSLKGCPQKVGGDFNFNYNKL